MMRPPDCRSRIGPSGLRGAARARQTVTRIHKSEDEHDTKQQVDDFLALKRIAVVGVSRDPKGFPAPCSGRNFRQRRYEAIPSNPVATEIDGQPCFARVQDITPPVRRRADHDHKGRDRPDCPRLRRGRRQARLDVRRDARGTATKEAVAFCRENDITVSSKVVPYMFLPVRRPSTLSSHVEEADRQLPEVVSRTGRGRRRNVRVDLGPRLLQLRCAPANLGS